MLRAGHSMLVSMSNQQQAACQPRNVSGYCHVVMCRPAGGSAHGCGLHTHHLDKQRSASTGCGRRSGSAAAGGRRTKWHRDNQQRSMRICLRGRVGELRNSGAGGCCRPQVGLRGVACVCSMCVACTRCCHCQRHVYMLHQRQPQMCCLAPNHNHTDPTHQPHLPFPCDLWCMQGQCSTGCSGGTGRILQGGCRQPGSAARGGTRGVC
jgi:hypothetical protein